MEITDCGPCGLQKTTLLDYPGHLAATVFIGGCNFRCPFCHNGGLVLQPGEHACSEAEILDFLKKRRNVLEGVCISGGEPTLYPNLLPFAEQVKALGFLVKLDTNGSNPGVVKAMAARGLIDYVAMDIKSSLESYPRICNFPQLNLEDVQETAAFLLAASPAGPLDYEFRTTLVKGLITREDILSIGRWIRGCKAYYLQAFRDSGAVLQQGLLPFSPEEMGQFQAILQPYIPNTFLRGF